MHKIKSTYKVLVEKTLQRGSMEVWKDWALEMMEAGFETEHLILLAGLSPNVNCFELDVSMLSSWNGKVSMKVKMK